MVKKKVKVPVKIQDPLYYNFFEVMHYLEEVHKKNFRDYAGKFGKNSDMEKPYQDFWHWMIDINDVQNGGWVCLPDLSYLDDPEVPTWKKEIIEYFHLFLGNEYDERMLASW
jgi:hypothetical protein